MKSKTSHIEAMAKGFKKVSPNGKLLKDFRNKFQEIKQKDDELSPGLHK